MATMTIAQALASSATGITVADSPAHIAAALPNPGLVARVTLFTLNASGASTASAAKVIATLGAKFNPGSFQYTVRDSVAALSDPNNAAGVAIASLVAVFDTAANLLAAANSGLMHQAASTLMSNSATLSLANLLKLETLPAFSVLPGQSITLADSAANLLALTIAQNRPAIKAFQVTVSATVSEANAVTLFALPSFSVVSGATLTISGAVAAMTTVGALVVLPHMAATRGVVVNVSDTLGNLLPAAGTLTSLAQSVSSLGVTMIADATVSVAQINMLVPLFGRFFVLAGHALTLADNLQNLLTATPNAVSLAQLTVLSQSANATTAQLSALTALHQFSVGNGAQLTVTGTLAQLNAVSTDQLAIAAAIVAQDTVTHLTAASSLPNGTTAILALMDGAQYTAAQAAQIGALATGSRTLTLVPNGAFTTMTIADTLQNLATFVPQISALVGHGPVTIAPTDANVTLTAAAVAALASLNAIDMSTFGISVSDNGAAITAEANHLFGLGLKSIIVLDGVFAGTATQLLDPTLHFGAGSQGFFVLLSTPVAQLGSDATVSTAQLVALSLLPGFSVAPGVHLTVEDNTLSLAANAAVISGFATAITVDDSATVTAAQAAQLAGIRAAVGAGNFSMAGHQLTISDSAANLANPANAEGAALATTLTLDADSVANAAQAAQLVAFGGAFSRGDFHLTVIDSAAALATLAGSGPRLAAVNAWGGQVLLSADATLSVVATQALQGFTGFAVGSNHLTLSDTATNLLAGGAAPTLAIANGVQLSAPATVTVAAATALSAMHGFSTAGQALTIADTPANLAALGGSVAALATTETWVTRTLGNAADFTISATQLAALQALAGLSISSGSITVSDTAAALSALAPSFVDVVFGSLLSRVVPALSADATVVATTASSLALLPGFSLAGHTLTILDSPNALLSPSAAAGISIAGSVGISAVASVSAAVATSLAALHNFTADAYPLTIADTPVHLAAMSGAAAAIAAVVQVLPYSAQAAADYTLTAAQFTAMASTANLSFTGFVGTITVSDDATNLVNLGNSFTGAPAGSALLLARAAISVTLSSDATVSAIDLSVLAGLPMFSLNGHTLVLQDTPSAILSHFPAGAPFATSEVLAANGTPWIVSGMDAARLVAMPGFVTGAAGMAVVDTATNILALPNAAGIAAAVSATLNADATVSAANAATLHAFGNFSVGAFHLTIQDSAGRLAAMDGDAAALASTIVQQGSGLISVSQFTGLRALPHFSTNGNALIVSDSATNLATLSGSDTSLATTLALNANATLSAGQAETLATLPNFTTGVAHLSVVDTAAHLVQITGGGSLPDDWAGELAATSVTLSQNATLTAAEAAELAPLGARLSLGGHTLTIADTAANLLSTINANGVALATALILSGPETGLSAAASTALAGLTNFAKGGNGITVSDTAANLLFAGYSAGLALADHVQLSAAAALSVSDAVTLVAGANFQVNASAVLSIADTLPNLLTLAGASLAHNTAVLQATAIGLSADTIATVAQLGTLATVPEYASFTRNGHALIVLDSGAHIAAYAPDSVALPTGYTMTGDATVSAAQANVLHARSVNLNGNDLTIADVPSAILNSSNFPGEGDATTIMLSADATVTASDATLLCVASRFTPGVHTLTVEDTAAAILGLSGRAVALVSSRVLVASQSVGVATLASLTALGSKFSLGDHTLTVSDTAANLATLDAHEPVLGSIQTMNADATIGAATATVLAALPNFTKGGHSITISDTASALLDLVYAAGMALADHEQLSAAASLTVASAEALIGLSVFQVNAGATLTIADTLPNLISLTGASLAHNTGVLQATAIGLSGDAVATTAQLAALAALPEYASFSRNGHLLTVQDTGAHIAAFSPDSVAVPTGYMMAGDATLSAAQADVLAARSVSLAGNALTIADTPVALLSGSHASGEALAAALRLSADATVTASQATSLFANVLFQTGGYVLTVSDVAASLLGLGNRVKLLATTLALSASQSVDVATLLGLTQLGVKFDLAGHTLTVQDTSAHLATLNSLETALSGGEVLGASATVTAAIADALAALPAFSLADGVTLTVQDSVTNLIELSVAAQAVATAELLPNAASVVVTATQGAALAALPHFSNSGASITVNDTVANLNAGGNVGWHSVATAYVVTDSVAHLAGAASTALLTDANSVTLSGDADIDAATLATLATIPAFTRGGSVLTVTDGPAAIAAEATAILAVASSAQVNASAPITATEADHLVLLNNAGKLSFSSGAHLALQDTYAVLSDGTHTAAMALATTVTVFDSAANVTTAIAHNWGSLEPYYELSSGGSVTGAQATAMAALGSHFLMNGQALVMADTALGVTGNSAALISLGILADVTDTTGNVVADTTGLVALGGRLASVTLTDSTGITAAQAAAFHSLALVLAGNTLTVADSAGAVSTNLANLELLGAHLGSVQVTDTAADIATVTTGGSAIQGLGSLLHITLTDSSAVLAAIAAGLAPVASYLVNGTSLAVTDTSAAIAGAVSALAQLGAALGTVTLSDGTMVSATVASGLVAIDGHLGNGVTLDVVDTAAALVSAAIALGTLRTDSRIHTIVAANELVANVVTDASALAALGATATISDSSAHVLAALDSLESLSTGGGILTAISLSDSPVVLTLTVSKLAADTDALALIDTSYGITVNDTAAHIQEDLASGSSTIVAHLAFVSSVVASDSGGIALTEAQAVAAGVADSFSSAMARFAGGFFTVTGVLASQVNAVAGLAITPHSMAIDDTAAHIQADLASGSSQLLAHRTLISGIVVSDSGTISLTDAQARTAHIDDGAGSVFSLISGGSLVVTGVTVADIDAIVALGVQPQSFAISDTAAHIQADLALGATSHMVANLGIISAIAVNDAGTVTLTEAQVLTTGVDDGSGSALSKLSGGVLAVSSVLAADVGTISSLPVAPNAIAVSDTAAHIQADLVSGSSTILGHLSLVTTIAINDGGTVVLTKAQVTAAGIDDSASAVLTKLSGGVFNVTGVAVADFTAILGLTVQPNSVAVSDTAAHIQADLLSGSSVLLAYQALVGSVAINDAGTITLTVAQITASGLDDGAGSTLGKTTGGALAVLGATVANFGALDALTRHADSIAVSDSAAHIQSDLLAGSPVLVGHVGVLASVSVTDGGTTTFTLSVAQLVADAGVVALLATPYDIAISDTAAHVQSDLASGSSTLLGHVSNLSSITLTDGGAPTITLSVASLVADSTVLELIGSTHNLAVLDTAANVQADLALGAASTILTNLGVLAGITLSSGHTIILTEAQAIYSGIDTALNETSGLTSLVVTGVTIAQIATVLGLGVSGTTITVSDTAAHVQSDLTGGSSVLLAQASVLGAIGLTDVSTPTITLAVSNLAADGTVLGLISSAYHLVVSDTAANVQSDLAAGASSNILAHNVALTSITLTVGHTITLTESEATYGGVGAALVAATGLTSFVVTGATVAQVTTVIALGITGTSVTVSDTAAHVQSDLTGGSSVLQADLSTISAITLTDGSTPTLTLSIAQLAADASVLALIGSLYHLVVSDTAANVQSDLASGGSSTILAHSGALTGITLTSGNAITLTATEALFSGVGSALAVTTGLTSFVVSSTTVAQLPTVYALGITGTQIAVRDVAANLLSDITGSGNLLADLAAISTITATNGSQTYTVTVAQLSTQKTVFAKISPGYLLAIDDTATNVQNDLALGATSAIVVAHTHISSSTLSSGHTITLTEAQVTASFVAGFLRITSGLTSLVVTNTTVAQIVTVVGLSVTGTSISISDTAANVQSDLTGGSSKLFANRAAIGSITLTDGTTPTITLSLTQLAADTSVLALIGSTYHLVVGDTAADVQSDLAAGALSTILANVGTLSSVTLTSGSTITLTEAQATYAGVADVLNETTGLTSFVVTGVTVAQITTVQALGVSNTTIDVSDTAANVQGDLTGGSSVLVAQASALGRITLTDGSTPTVTLAVSDLAADGAVLGLISTSYHLEVSDTAAHVQSDLAAGASSEILAHSAALTGITLTVGHTITLTAAQATYSGVGAVLALTTGLTSFAVTGATVAQVATVVALGITGTSVTVSDTAAHVQSDLNNGSSVLLANVAQITSIALTDGGTPTLALNVAGLTADSTVLALIVSSYNLAVSDTAAHVQSDLAGGATSQILAQIGTLASVTLTSGGTITLTEGQATYSGVAAALIATTGLTSFVVTGTTVAQIATVLALSVPDTTIGIDDTAANVEADITGGGSLLANVASLAGITLTDGSAPTIALTVAQLSADSTVLALIGSVYHIAISDTAAHVRSDLIGGSSTLIAHGALISTIALTDGGTPSLSLTVAEVASSSAMLALITSSYSIAISDTAAHVQADLTSGSSGLVARVGQINTITLTDGGTPTITLNIAQLAVDSTVLGLIVSSHNLVIDDTAANVRIDLAAGASSTILANLGAVTGITLSSGHLISLTEAQATYAGVATALAETSGLTTLAVTATTIAQIPTVLALGISGTSISVSDTAAHVQSDLTGGSSILTADVSALHTITLTDGGTPTITLNVAQLAADTTVLGLVVSTYHLAISDTATDVQADLAAGGASQILAQSGVLSGVTLTVGNTITLTEAQAVFSGVAAILAVTSGLTSFVVTGVTVAQVATVLALGVTGTSISLSDTAAHVQSDLTGGSSVLVTDVAVLGSITLTDGGTPTITLTVAQLAADSAVLALIGSAYDIAISDTAAHVQSDLASSGSSTIIAALTSISTITLTGGTTITLTSAQAQFAGVDNSGSSAIAKMTNLSGFVVTQVLVADIATVLTGLNVPPTAISVLDSAAHIGSDIGGPGLISTYQSTIAAVRTTETTLNATTATNIYNGLHAITTFDESSLTITDSAATLLTAATAAPAMLSAALNVTMSDNPTGLTAAQATTLAGVLRGVLGNSQTMGVADTATNLLLGGNVAGIALATSVTLSALTTTTAAIATQLVALHAYTAGPAITVQDTPTNLLNASYATGINAATTVELDSNYSVTAADLAALALLHGYAAGSHSLTVTGSVSAILALSQPALGFSALASITDTTATVVANLAALQAALPAHSHALSIALTDATINVLSINTTATIYASDSAVFAAITTGGIIKVTGNATDLAAIATALAANAAVGEVDVSDTAANILSSLTTLNAIPTLHSATITDTSVNAAEVSALLTIPNLIATNLTISDTGSQIAAALLANGAPGVTFMNAHTVQLSADSVVGASDALLLEGLTSFTKNGHRLYVWDTASHLTDSVDGYLAAVQAALVNGVYLKAAGNSATISASLAASLLSIPAFNRNDPPSPAGDGVANTLIVQDTAAHIESAFSSLNANRSALSSIVVSATATVTDAVFGDLLTLGAAMAATKTLTVRDTAANIVANAASQTAGSPSIAPTAWQISASASVTTAGAILLAGLPGFSIGAFTLTLTDSVTISVAQANTLGTLSTSLRLNGHVLEVDGSVATMTSGPGLNSNAKLIVTPHITDTFANIATLTTGSGLLGGTITITDSESITVSQANAFLALLGGSGIPVANVTFGGHVQSVTDTLSNIQTLTGSLNWTSNVSVHVDFNLVVADTAATLINPSNTATLATMNGTTLSANQSVTAANAESLFAVENTIHFTKGSHTLTALDTVSNMLNAANSDGIVLADALQLSADGTIAAADAEALLTNAKFHVNGHTLTVSDSSDNLLDGILSGDITGSADSASLVVELAAPETLDAGTATALVGLPHFTNNGDLSIADGASYLLNIANRAAEVAAVNVTLSGDETVSVGTAVRLAALPHFTLGSNVLHLASNDFADAAALVVIGDFGAGFDHGSFNVSMTQDALALTPTEYTNLQSDGVVLNGHALSALATGISVTSGAGIVHVSGAGIGGATLNVYASSGSSLSQTPGAAASFTANASEGAIGNGVVVTETVGASAATSESAPIIALEQTVLTNAATAASATFAGSGAVQVGVSQYIDIYTTATAPAHPTNPVLVYDAAAHTLSLNIDSHAPVVLVTLGAATHPTTLTASEIFIQHFS
jgi:hypothetical protein